MSRLPPRAPPPGAPTPRAVCPTCRRPLAACVCAVLPRVANRTPIFILQHLRERRHPFNTVRLLRTALARLEVTSWGAHMNDAAGLAEAFRARLPAGTALLYPTADTPLLTAANAPAALLLVDGTWSQARTVLRDLPWLRALPRFRIPNPTPDRYRIRAEPSAESASTLEALVRALEILEPETAGLAGLLNAFDTMIDRQLDINAPPRPRRQRRRERPSRAIPEAIRHLSADTLLGIGETVRTPAGRALVYWVALRPATGETFAQVIAAPGVTFSPELLTRFELSEVEAAGAVPPALFLERWRAFAGADPLLITWGAGERRSLSFAPPRCLSLKSTYCNLRQTASGHLDELIAREGLTEPSPHLPGRAGRRLAHLEVLWRWLGNK